jgi:hypothetical protein
MMFMYQDHVTFNSFPTMAFKLPTVNSDEQTLPEDKVSGATHGKVDR